MKVDISTIKELSAFFGDGAFQANVSLVLAKMSNLDKMDLEAECNVAKLTGGNVAAFEVLEKYVNEKIARSRTLKS